MRIIDIFRNIPDNLKRMYRLTKVSKRSEIVWDELIKLHKLLGLNYGLYEKDKYLETSFGDDENGVLRFRHSVDNNRLLLSALILPEFEVDCINDVMILASHFNNLLTRGIVSVNIEHRYVEFQYSGDLLRYMLYPIEIYTDIQWHYSMAEECFRTYTEMINTRDEPVFAFAEFMKRMEQKDKTPKDS